MRGIEQSKNVREREEYGAGYDTVGGCRAPPSDAAAENENSE
jgi:hypothetical protein